MLGHGSPLRAALTGHDDDYKKKKRQPPRRVRSLTKKVARKRATKLLLCIAHQYVLSMVMTTKGIAEWSPAAVS